jgi:hypothetical protein
VRHSKFLINCDVAPGKAEFAMPRTVFLLLLIFSISLSLVLPTTSIANPQTSRATAAAPLRSARRGQSIQQPDGGWPRGYSLPSEAQIVIFQPQVATWEEEEHMVALAAVSFVAKGETKPTLGTIKIEADTSVALEQRVVRFSTLKITEANFQALSKDQTREIVTEIEKTIPPEERMIGLDRVLAQMDKSLIIPKNVEGLKADPPKIFLSRTPAILLSFDGDPIWSPIKENELKFAVNTNWDVFQHNPQASTTCATTRHGSCPPT